VAPHRKNMLPRSTREKLASPIRVALSHPVIMSGPHTMPVSQESWQHYASSINVVLTQLQDRSDEQPENDFVSIRHWVEEFLGLRGRVISLTRALRPFEYFQESQADEMLTAVNRLTLCVAEMVETDLPLGAVTRLDSLAVAGWSSIEFPHQGEPLSRAFGLGSEDLRDADGEFSPARVFSAYYLQNGKLMQRVLLHLHSMGLPPIVDPLVAVSIVGWIESAVDEVGAYCAMDALFNRMLSRSHQAVVVSALNHLEEIEPRLRLSRVRANRSFAPPPLGTDVESTALDLPEGYKRLLEGPVRQYGWLFYCMGTGSWSNPPMLTKLRELLVKDRGWITHVAERMILTEVRNGEAHEGLWWDGINEVFRTEAGPVDRTVVHVAAVKADAFARGSQAAVACYRALSIKPEIGGPRVNDRGRSPDWLRAEAHFGTNGLQVIKANFNSKIARITVMHLREDNINPCFQALVCCHALLPSVERFEIYVNGDPQPLVSLSADALERTHPIWEGAIDKFRLMPFSTFLPANLDARSNLEAPAKAVRSVSWIALEDLLDALDSSSEHLDAGNLTFLVERAELVAAATKECLAAVASENGTRLRTVNSIVAELLEQLKRLHAPVLLANLYRTAAVLEARRVWELWGPVPRLPGVLGSLQTTPMDDPGPRLRSEQDRRELNWRTI
jgi:hypothetical protein